MDPRLTTAAFASLGLMDVGMGIRMSPVKAAKPKFTNCKVCGNPCRTHICHKCQQKAPIELGKKP